jgi:hypothetical protein
MDRLDDDQIVAQLEGRLPEVLTYHYKDGGQEIWGLSKVGVDEAKGELAKTGKIIREEDLTFTVDGNDAMFVAKAGMYAIDREGNEHRLQTKIGQKRQSKKIRKKDGRIVNNPHWFEQGGQKALRNAVRDLIPTSIKEAVIEYAKRQGKVKEVKENGGEKAPDKTTPKRVWTFDDMIKAHDLPRKTFDLFVAEGAKARKVTVEEYQSLVLAAPKTYIEKFKKWAAKKVSEETDDKNTPPPIKEDKTDAKE